MADKNVSPLSLSYSLLINWPSSLVIFPVEATRPRGRIVACLGRTVVQVDLSLSWRICAKFACRVCPAGVLLPYSSRHPISTLTHLEYTMMPSVVRSWLNHIRELFENRRIPRSPSAWLASPQVISAVGRMSRIVARASDRVSYSWTNFTGPFKPLSAEGDARSVPVRCNLADFG